MKTNLQLALCAALLLLATGSLAQTDDTESLRMAALEALISAPPERALPIVDKVLAGSHSSELKERALFILSQMDTAEAQSRLLAFANDSEGELQAEAIRMIGIGGDDEALAQLGSLYTNGDKNVREAVLEAYLISGNKQHPGRGRVFGRRQHAWRDGRPRATSRAAKPGWTIGVPGRGVRDFGRLRITARARDGRQ
jgi:HEAT repeat protein